MAADASPVENSFTGTDTRPNDKVADPMGCALIAPQCAGRGLMISLLPHGCKGEGPSRSVKYLPRKAVSRPHAGARGARGGGQPVGRGVVRGAHARRPPAALGPPPRDGRPPQVVGGPQGPVAQSRR